MNSNRTTSILGGAGLIVLSVAVALLISEISLRAFYPQRLYYNITQWDPYVGFVLIPGIEGYALHEEFEMNIKINSHGLRDREIAYAKPEGVIRIGIFGDSFTFGEGVQDDESYPKVLERLINKDSASNRKQPEIETLNFGVGKTSTSHQLALYQKEGVKYDLDIVVVGFLSGNDFDNNLDGVFLLKEGVLVHNPAAYSSVRKIQAIVYKVPFYRWLAGHSHLVNLMRKTATIANDRLRKKINREKQGTIMASRQGNKYVGMYDITVRLFKTFEEEARKNGSQFMVANIPVKNQRPLRAYSENEDIKPYIRNDDKLLKFFREQKIHTLDLVPVFSQLPTSKYYFKNDGHMNAQGNALVAEKLLESIRPAIAVVARTSIDIQ